MSKKMSLKGESDPTDSVQTFGTGCKQTESFHMQVDETVIIVSKVPIRRFALGKQVAGVDPISSLSNRAACVLCVRVTLDPSDLIPIISRIICSLSVKF